MYFKCFILYIIIHYYITYLHHKARKTWRDKKIPPAGGHCACATERRDLRKSLLLGYVYGLIGYVVEVEVEEAGFRPFVLHRQRHELLLQIKRNGGGVSVHGQEAAAGLVVGEEKALDEV